jgi:hypothetical protein
MSGGVLSHEHNTNLAAYIVCFIKNGRLVMSLCLPSMKIVYIFLMDTSVGILTI